MPLPSLLGDLHPPPVHDYAILTVLARLGLRAGEVTSLQLDNIDWRSGAIIVHGKGNIPDRLPLPVDIGDAIVAYLSVYVHRACLACPLTI